MKLNKIKQWAVNMIGLKKKSAAPPVITAKNYNEVYYEMETLKKELAEMNDSTLISTIAELSQMYLSGQVDMIVEDFMITGVLDPEDRQDLENYYLFVNMDLGITA
jgi:hypothetical protein